MNKLTDNDIIKALECCSKDDIDCEQCPANGICDADDYCITGAILDLINRQKAEIERLNDLFDSAQDNSFNAIHLLYEMREKFNRQKVELSKKDTEIDILIRKKEALRDENSELKAEIERLKELLKSSGEYINNLEKEMTEGGEG